MTLDCHIILLMLDLTQIKPCNQFKSLNVLQMHMACFRSIYPYTITMLHVMCVIPVFNGHLPNLRKCIQMYQ